MRPALLLAIPLLLSCGAHVSDGQALAATTPSARPTITVAPAPTSSAVPSSTPLYLYGGPPIALGKDPTIGTIAGGILGGFAYSGLDGSIAEQPIRASGSGERSPSGRWLTQQRNIMSGGFIERTDLWIVDQVTGAERLLYTPPADPPSQRGPAQPNPNVPPYAFERTEYVGSWSPDERYLTMWIVGLMSASIDADGRPFAVIDVATGAMVEVGYTLFYQYAWRAPHTLAYIAGGGRETWLNKMLRVWTPEGGARDISAPADVALAPTWAPDGRLWFVSGPAGPYDPPTFFAGRGIGDRSIIGLDLATGSRTAFPRVADYADEGVRFSDDGKSLLVLRRKLTVAATRDSWVELWSAKPDGTKAQPLVRLSGYGGFGYYGGFAPLAKLDWQR